ncbi:MAG: type IIL restriction-modification enzyme MmeI, partial [Pseudomonadota bacterium]
AAAYRRDLLENVEFTPYLLLQQKLGLADEALRDPKFLGDVVIAAFFSKEKDKDRRKKRNELLDHAVKEMDETDWESVLVLEDALNWLRIGGPPVRPFHWELEFPEVFGRENGGFDGIVGNPPFAAGRNISGFLGTKYLRWLHSAFHSTAGQTDMVVFFFRRSYEMLRKCGCLGLLSTNTVSQGDTRQSGLTVIRNNGGCIYDVVKRVPWSGAAAVTTSVIHISKNNWIQQARLDGRCVEKITAFLFDKGNDQNPASLASNSNIAFKGYMPNGAGFTFDDAVSGAHSLDLMRNLLELNSQNARIIHPLIGGEEFLNDPMIRHRRYVIDFDKMSEEVAREWTELFALVEQSVKPERQRSNSASLRDYWWQFERTRPGLRRASQNLLRLLMKPFYAKHTCFAFVPNSTYIASPHVALTADSMVFFAVLQSRVHEVWARFFGSSMKDDLRYTPSDCFETFPFPSGVLETSRQDERAKSFLASAPETVRNVLDRLEQVGRGYCEFRADLMIRNNEGLTKTYNRFHDPYETSPDIKKLRDLHDAMDLAVLDAYGWTDLKPTCEFLLDYEDEDEDEDEDDENGGSSRGRSRKKPWRYRWPDEFRDEVLARLLELNKERAEQERLAGLAADAGSGKAKGNRKKGTGTSKRKRKKEEPEGQPNLFARKDGQTRGAGPT